MWSLLIVFYFILAVCLHGAVARLKPTGNRVQQFMLTGGACGAALLGHLFELNNLSWLEWLAGGIAYAFAGELYIFLFTFVTSSISVALLVGSGTAADSALNPDEMVRQRLETMSAAGLLDRSGSRLHLNRRSRTIVTFYRGLRHFFRHDLAQ